MDEQKLELNPQVLEYLIDIFEPHCRAVGLSADQVINNLRHAMTTPPLISTLRVNILKYTLPTAISLVNEEIHKCYRHKEGVIELPVVRVHSMLKDMLLIPADVRPRQVHPSGKHLTVDLLCGAAVLRGANVFAPGILSAPKDASIGDHVAVFADKDGTCPRGLAVPFEGSKIFVGNGVLHQQRSDWFGAAAKNSGIAIEMTDPLYVQPSLNQRELGDVVFPQNFPSMVVAHVLNPTSGDVVLDMCAGPGGKMTHLATLMGNKGKLIALDKSVGKTSIMKSHVDKFQLKNVACYTFDATKCCSLETSVSAADHPPFPIGSFDKILLDAPCSGFGQRPQFKYSLSLARFKSYQTYQRSLLHQAVHLLKPGGILVYSTCSMSPDENECQVYWVLSTFPNMHLVSQEPYLGHYGLQGYGLSVEECHNVQRFGPLDWYKAVTGDCDNGDNGSDNGATGDSDNGDNGATGDSDVCIDSVGFFIAKFIKTALL